MAQLCQQYELHPGQINDWKRLLPARAAELFDTGKADEPVNLAPLQAKIWQQALELDFLNSALTKAGLLSAGR
jgi:transposase